MIPLNESKSKLLLEASMLTLSVHLDLDSSLDFAHHNTENTCKDADRMVQSFWYWNSIIPYINFILLIVMSLLAFTLMFGEYKAYNIALGVLSALIEACLGVPQFLLNFKNKNTTGLS